jgi:hypothetical protein
MICAIRWANDRLYDFLCSRPRAAPVRTRYGIVCRLSPWPQADNIIMELLLLLKCGAERREQPLDIEHCGPARLGASDMEQGASRDRAAGRYRSLMACPVGEKSVSQLHSNALRTAASRQRGASVISLGDMIRFSVRDRGPGVHPSSRPACSYQPLVTRCAPGAWPRLVHRAKHHRQAGGQVGESGGVPGRALFHFTLPATTSGVQAARPDPIATQRR